MYTPEKDTSLQNRNPMPGGVLLLSLSEKANFLLEVDNFLQERQMFQSIDDFAIFQEQLLAFLKGHFASILTGKTESFILAFDQGNVSKYQKNENEDEHEMRRLLRELLQEKNRLYGQIFLRVLDLGLFETLLTNEEREDLENILHSEILPYFDDIYINWLASKINENISEPERPLYAGMKNGELVAYSSLTQRVFKKEHLEKIHNPYTRAYLLAMAELLENGKFDYKSWVAAQVFESKIWKDPSSRIGFITPMEDYVFAGYFVEPELLFVFKDQRNKVDNGQYFGLSEKYFGEKYGMDCMTCTPVVTLLQGGEATFGGFIGKAFPNDIELSQKEGNNIILRSTPMKMSISNAIPYLKKLLPDERVDDEILFIELLQEVTYHEFGHSLFVKSHPTSLLEESKASLFYYLSLFDANEENPASTSEIRKIIVFSLVDSIRTIERFTQGEFLKYVIHMKVVVKALFESGLLVRDGENIRIVPEISQYGLFLGELKDLLDMIEPLYGHEGKELEDLESGLLMEIEKAQVYVDFPQRKWI